MLTFVSQRALINLLDCAALLHGAGTGRRCCCLCGCRLLDDGYDSSDGHMSIACMQCYVCMERYSVSEI
jgi:hypothetical protein